MYIHVYKIRIATVKNSRTRRAASGVGVNSWPAVHVCEGSLQVARLSAILLYF